MLSPPCQTTDRGQFVFVFVPDERASDHREGPPDLGRHCNSPDQNRRLELRDLAQ
jgi:hypothetical protein